MTALLTISHLTIRYNTPEGQVHALEDVNIEVQKGEIYALVGESGCGKSTLLLACAGLLPPNAYVLGGSIHYRGYDLVRIPERTWATLRGRFIAIIFQDPLASLNPVITVGDQILEVLRTHRGLRGKAAQDAAVELLEKVRMTEPRSRLRAYPHELSGGQCQRSLIAMALAGQPEILLADEPTTALDVTVQSSILALMEELRRSLGLTLIWVTHDLSVVARFADRLGVLYAGRLVEEGPVPFVHSQPQHPYTRMLWEAVPTLETMGKPLRPIPGEFPNPVQPLKACPFTPRCPEVLPRCHEAFPPWVREKNHGFACWARLSIKNTRD